jgi:hypothetical protein
MPNPRIADLAARATVAAAFLLALFILLAPTGSLVRTPLEHTRAQIEARGQHLAVVHAATAALPDR